MLGGKDSASNAISTLSVERSNERMLSSATPMAMKRIIKVSKDVGYRAGEVGYMGSHSCIHVMS